MLSPGPLLYLFFLIVCAQFYTNFLSFELFPHGLLKWAELFIEEQGQESPSYSWKCYLQSHQMFMGQMHVVNKVFEKLGISSQPFPGKSQTLTLQLSGWKQENSQSSCSQGSLGSVAISLPTQVWPLQLKMKVNKLDLCCRFYRFLLRREPLPSWTLSAWWK